MKLKQVMRKRTARASLAATAALVLGAGVTACGGSEESTAGEGSGASEGGGGTVNLVAYSTPQEVYANELIPAFQQTPGGEGTEFTTSFAGSGDSRRAVEAGQPTDFVHLPLEPDMTILEQDGLIPSDYKDEKHGGSPQTSVVVFVTRPGNPENIETWDDLLEGDLEVINANPFTSGGARWNVMAAYGQAIEGGASEEEALKYVADLFQHIPVQDASARDALNTFLSGKGDVLLSYENEAIAAQNAGEDLDYVIPDSTIEILTLDAVASEAENPEGAAAFREFLRTPEAQTIWAENGYRPVDKKVFEQFADQYPEPKGLFTIEDLGGWPEVMGEFFDLENGKIAEIQKSNGVPVE